MRRSAGPVVALVVSVAVLVVISLLAGSSGTSDADPSSRSNGKAGTLALYLWLDQLGLPVHRVSGDFDLSGSDVLVVDSPSVAFSAADAAAVRDFVRSGGEVILALDGSDPTPAARLLGVAGIGISGEVAAGTAEPVAPVDAAATVRSVPVSDGFTLGGDAGVVPLLTQGGGRDVAAGSTAAGGAGRVYVLGDAQPLSNDGLRHGDSAAFVLALVEHARGGQVAFDEYHHGEIGNQGANAVLYGPVGLAGVLAVLTVVAYLAISGRRIGRAVVVGDASAVPTAGQYLGAMAQLFERSRRRGGVADRYADELKRRVGAATGLDPHLADDGFIAQLRGHGEDRAGEVAAALRRARDLAAATPGEPDLLRLAEQVAAAGDRFAAGAALRE